MPVDFNLKDAGLKSLQASVKDAKGMYLKVGILGSYARNTGSGGTNKRRRGIRGRYRNGKYQEYFDRETYNENPSNADVGKDMEFGVFRDHVPARSWLRMPIFSKLGDEIAKESPEVWQELLLQFGFAEVLREVGERALAVIKDAFKTGGFGRWQQLHPRTIRNKGSARILIETGQLQKAVTYAVVGAGSPKKPL